MVATTSEAKARSKSSPSGAHIPALDGVRGLAILAVLFVHAFPTGGPDSQSVVVEAGAFGVDLFFVLSGFLITGILIENKGRDHYFRNFYARRALRLFPLYYAYLIIVMVAVPALHQAMETSVSSYSGNWLWYFAYLSNWKPNFGATDPFLGHFWSLAVEEQFYLIWPSVVLLTTRRQLTLLCIGLIVAATSLRIVWTLDDVHWNQIYRLTPARCDTMALGALAAIAIRSDRWRPVAYRVARSVLIGGFVGFVAVALYAGSTSWRAAPIRTVGATMAALCFTGLVLSAVSPQQGRLKRALALPFLTTLGKYSYCLYVVHILFIVHLQWIQSSVVRAFPAAGPLAPVVFPLIAVAATFIVAKLSWRYFEAPILALKNRFHSAPAVPERPRNLPSTSARESR